MKYTFEEKLKAVRHRLETGGYAYPEGCRTVRQRKLFSGYVRFWTAQYLEKGEEGLRHSGRRAYSAEEKLALIEPILRGSISFRQQSRASLINPGQLEAWIRRYREAGAEG